MKFIQDALEEMVTAARAKGLSMRRACELAGVHHTTVSRWRNGHTSPRMAEFVRLHETIRGYDARRKQQPQRKEA